MSASQEIQIEDQHGGVLHLAHTGGGVLEVLSLPAPERPTVEIDESDRKDLRDWLGAIHG